MTYAFVLLAILNGQIFTALLVENESTCEAAKSRLDNIQTEFQWECVQISGVLEKNK